MNDNVKRHFDRLKIEAITAITHNAPYRTGNLRNNIKYRDIPNGFEITIDVSYMQYTEEAWDYNSRWGKILNNPNQYWLRDTTKTLADRFANKVKGIVK